MQYDLTVRNAQNDAIAQAVGPSPVLEIRTGPPPARCDLADSGVLIASGKLPQDWLTQSADGVTERNGLWSAVGLPAAAATPGGHFRIKSPKGCHMQGTYGPGKDMVPSAGLIEPGQLVKIVEFRITRGNA